MHRDPSRRRGATRKSGVVRLRGPWRETPYCTLRTGGQRTAPVARQETASRNLCSRTPLRQLGRGSEFRVPGHSPLRLGVSRLESRAKQNRYRSDRAVTHMPPPLSGRLLRFRRFSSAA